jgi:hypothetical protein
MGAPSAAPTVSNPPTAGISPVLWALKGATSVTVSTAAANRPLLLPGSDTADSSNDGVSEPLKIQPIDIDASNLPDGLITTAFQWLRKGAMTYSHCQYT